MIPIYEVVLDEDFSLNAVSFVTNPAILTDFIYQNNLKSNIYLSNEKREVISPILIPNQLIYREYNNAPYYLKWTEESIKGAYLSLKDRRNNTTYQHNNKGLLNDVICLNLWLITNPTTDTINTKYGFNLPKGTLCIHYKINNDELWQKIKAGEVKGLSIEAFANITKEIKMNKIVDLLNEFSQRALTLSEELKEETVTLADNRVIVLKEGKAYYEGELLGEGTYAIDEEKELVIDSEGTYTISLLEKKESDNTDTELVEEEVTVNPTDVRLTNIEERLTKLEEVISRLDEAVKALTDVEAKVPEINQSYEENIIERLNKKF